MRKDADPGTKQLAQAQRDENVDGSELLLALSQADPSSTQLTRRELLVAVAAATLAGCSQTTPLPPFALGRTGTLYRDGTVPSALGNAVIQRISVVGGIPDATFVPSLKPAPDLILTFGELPKGYTGASIGASPLTIITHLRVPIDSISADQALALLSGTITDWSALGAPYSLPVHLLALQGLALPPGVPRANTAQTLAKRRCLTACDACPGRKRGACSTGTG